MLAEPGDEREKRARQEFRQLAALECDSSAGQMILLCCAVAKSEPGSSKNDCYRCRQNRIGIELQCIRCTSPPPPCRPWRPSALAVIMVGDCTPNVCDNIGVASIQFHHGKMCQMVDVYNFTTLSSRSWSAQSSSIVSLARYMHTGSVGYLLHLSCCPSLNSSDSPFVATIIISISRYVDRCAATSYQIEAHAHSKL